MIKLTRAAAPLYLTSEKVAELTERFKVTGKSVWNDDNIKIPLLFSGNGKCAYCECPLTTESNYMEVEHFENKDRSPEKVVLWENLLPSCKKCNGAKGAHDVLVEPIVNPFVDDPREHIALRFYRMKGKTPLGKSTIDVANLNHSDRLVLSRFKVGEAVSDLIDTSWERFEKYQESRTTRAKNRLVNVVEGLLSECQPTAAYSASTATILLTDARFNELVFEMKEELIWSDTLDCLHNQAMSLVLECS